MTANSTALSNVTNDLQNVKTMLGTVYSTNHAVKAVIGDYIEVCSLILPTSGVYFVLAHAELSISDSNAIENVQVYANDRQVVNARTTAESGGGLNVSVIEHYTAGTKLWVQCYGYSKQSDYEHRAYLQALKLSN